jgi:hypothetical protein
MSENEIRNFPLPVSIDVLETESAFFFYPGLSYSVNCRLALFNDAVRGSDYTE